MKSIILFLFLPLLIQSQQHSSANFGSTDIENVNVNNRLRKGMAALNIIGSKFYHNKFIPTTVNGKKIKVKYDALDDNMRLQVGIPLFTFPKNEILILDNKESWIVHENIWYRILDKRNGFTYLLKPVAKFYPAKKAGATFEDSKSTPAEFKISNKFYSLSEDKLILLKRKEIKKLGLKKLLED